MLHKEATILNKLGLNARASAKLTKLAGQFDSEVWITRNGRRVNAKSIMGVMTLAANKGSVLEIEISRKDEATAMDAIVALINNLFDEDE